MASRNREGREVDTTGGVGQVRVGEPGPGEDQTAELHGAGAPIPIEDTPPAAEGPQPTSGRDG